MNYLNANEDTLFDSSPTFETICLPGMTEQFKLNVFIYVDPDTNLRFTFICEDNNEVLRRELHGFSLSIIQEFQKKKLLYAIEVCETDMFSRISKKPFLLIKMW